MKKLTRLLAVLLSLTLLAAACGSDSVVGDVADAAGDAVDTAGDAAGDVADAASDTASDVADAVTGDDDAMEDDDAMMEDVTISYWLWDNNQQPFYQQCADDFAADSGITVEITQLGWGDYWDGLSAGFATGDVPDVFTDHLAKYPEFVFNDVLVPLNDMIDANGTPTDIYWDGLADLWVAPDGSRYGLPKDFDTIALVVNADMLADSDLTADDLQNLDWNPSDGGSFEAAIAHLSIDANGNRGDSADFDPENVATYGYTSNSNYADAYSQTGWSAFTGSNGFEFTDSNPWGTSYNYDSSEFSDVILWWRTLIEKGFMPPSDILSGTGSDTLFSSGAAASMTDGSWKIGAWTEGDVNGIFVPTPIGPTGERASMYNGLADSITRASDHPDAAFQWVQYMASAACQDVIGEGAVVFPAIPSATGIAQEARLSQGVDVSAFTTHVDNGTTFLFPITIEGSEVQRIMGNAIDAVLRGEGDASTLADANTEINDLIASSS